MNNDDPRWGPLAYELWRQAGGGTELFDPVEYRRLMREHGMTRKLDPVGLGLVRDARLAGPAR